MATKTTATGKALESYIQDVLNRAKSGATAAGQAGYPAESALTQSYYAGIPSLYMYGDAAQAEALKRMSDVYGGYGAAGEYAPGQFDMADYTAQNIQKRMSPYEELVAQRMKARAEQAYKEGRGQRETEAIRAGAFGGSGMAIREAMAERDYLDRLKDMDAESLQKAFESGSGLYSKEMADRLAAQQAFEQSRQFGAGLGLDALRGQATAAESQANLAEQQKRMQLANLAAQQQAGAQQEQYALGKQEYPLTLAQKQANVIPSAAGTAATTVDKTSTMQNILGGLSAGAGVLQGLGGLSGIKSMFSSPSIYRDGGLVPHEFYYRYNGGGLADLEPEYYDGYER